MYGPMETIRMIIIPLHVPILGDWVPLGIYHFFPFSLPHFVLVLHVISFNYFLQFDSLFVFDSGNSF